MTMKSMKKILGAVLLCLLLCACTREEELGPIRTNTLEIFEDGSLIEYQVEDFPQDIYDVRDLQSAGLAELNWYNNETQKPLSSTQKPLVGLKEARRLEEDPDKACLAMEFQSVQALKDYYAFWEVERHIFYGTVAEAIGSGYILEGKLYPLKGSATTAVSSQQLEKIMSKKVLILDEGTRVRFPGEILYKSNNIIGGKNGECGTTPGQENIIVFK